VGIAAFQLTVSGTGNTNLDNAYSEGCATYLEADGGSGILTLLCPSYISGLNKNIDPGTFYFNQGLTTYGCGQYGAGTCARAYFIMRKNNIWEMWDIQGGTYQNPNVSQKLFHTKFKYDSKRPPCSAVWIKDADGSEVTLNSSGLCENVAVTSITLPATICAGQSLPVSFTTSVSAASYKVELLNYKTSQYLCGGPSDNRTTLMNSVTTTTNNASIPIEASFNSSGCRTEGGNCGYRECNDYRIRITPAGSTQGVSQLFAINGVSSPTATANTAQSGNWNTTSTWQCGTIPTATNIVQIQSGHIIELNTDAHAKSVNFLGTGNINYTGTAAKLLLNQ